MSTGPWDPRAQHGGPPSALLAYLLAEAAGDDGLVMARMTFELLRPVPVGRVSVSVAQSRGGKRVRLFEASISDDGGVEVMRARALRVAPAGAGIPPVGGGGAAMAPLPEPYDRPEWRARPGPLFAPDAIEVRVAAGAIDEPGPAAAWFRLRVPVIEGVALTGLQRVAAAADFGNGIASVVSWEGHTFINPDLTVYLEREPAGEWIGLDAETRIGTGGIGVAESVLYDEHGRVGRAVQALLVARR